MTSNLCKIKQNKTTTQCTKPKVLTLWRKNERESIERKIIYTASTLPSCSQTRHKSSPPLQTTSLETTSPYSKREKDIHK